jgi:hypothetical protein
MKRGRGARTPVVARGLRTVEPAPEDLTFRWKAPRRRRRPPLTLGEAVVGIGLIGLLMGTVYADGHNGREYSTRIGCSRNLRQIALASMLYADDNEGAFPDRLSQLHPDYVENARCFSCPGAPSRWREFEDGRETAASSSYVLVPGLRQGMPSSTILLYDKSRDNHDRTVRVVAYVDGRAEYLEEADFLKKLARQRKALGAWRRAGARDVDVKKFLRSGATAGAGAEGREDQ